MRKFRRADAVVEAVQITDDTFDAPHPNDEHVPGLIYEPVLRMVVIERADSMSCANVADWIVREPNGEVNFCKAEVFAATYQPISDA